MKTPIGSTFMYNIILVFVIIVFAFLAGIMSYYKAFKINNRIVYAIEKFEGYNTYSIEEINRILNNLGYDRGTPSCEEEYDGMTLVSGTNPEYRYCIYVEENITRGKAGTGTYYSYGVRSYMSIDLPVVSWIRIPIYTKTNQIYKFTDTHQAIY
ncbi:MAG: hypothetical protein J6B98_01425 [Bacilli bacterium]|nr:hypothetical protein [Bacilli bacterium]